MLFVLTFWLLQWPPFFQVRSGDLQQLRAAHFVLVAANARALAGKTSTAAIDVATESLLNEPPSEPGGKLQNMDASEGSSSSTLREHMSPQQPTSTVASNVFDLFDLPGPTKGAPSISATTPEANPPAAPAPLQSGAEAAEVSLKGLFCDSSRPSVATYSRAQVATRVRAAYRWILLSEPSRLIRFLHARFTALS